MATINVNLSAAHDGRGREGFKGAMLKPRSSRRRLLIRASNKVSKPRNNGGALGVKSIGDYSRKYIDHLCVPTASRIASGENSQHCVPNGGID